MSKLKDRSLYLIITEEFCRGRTAVEVARLAIAGGVDIIQMREKDRPFNELLAKGKELLAVCKGHGVPFIVNDDPELTREIGADGVHLGQEDMRSLPVEKARAILGREAIIGISTHSLEQLRKAQGFDADYIAFGPIFPTKTKDYSIGTSGVREAAAASDKPVFFIGGIDASNLGTLVAEGARRIALIRALAGAGDVRSAAARLKKMLSLTRKKGCGMTIRINGKAEAAGPASNLEELVRARMLSPDKIVVEHNMRIVSKEDWLRTPLEDGDVLEIISFVGGG